ncbi:MAG: DUF4040 domain-containing protein [Leptolyngbyaceae cyanobacterium MO_188.B28]|nr:DUF4040 domain-containing protein [Leptolyngbyaceae cyanobacterium MO_188.B28]
MTEDFYILAISALLPLTACMLVFQANPYHALVIRGILGAIAALVYVLFGAADVALTEALVGTMLSITLYAIAVRSSLSMRIGVLSDEFKPRSGGRTTQTEHSERMHPSEQVFSTLEKALGKHHMRLELIPYETVQALQTALATKEVHTTLVLSEQGANSESTPSLVTEDPFHHIQTRVHRLLEIMQADLPPTLANLTYVDLSSPSQAVANQSKLEILTRMEKQL